MEQRWAASNTIWARTLSRSGVFRPWARRVNTRRNLPVTRTGLPTGHRGGYGYPAGVHQDLCRATLRANAAAHWPQAGELEFRYRGAFIYVEADLPDGTVRPLIRLRYGASARHWGFGLYLASSGTYENQILPPGFPSRSHEQALDCACRLYLDNPY